MRVTCRSCGATGSAEQVFGDADVAQALMIAGEMPPAIARAVWHYLALFRPAKHRNLTWPRTRKLLQELLDLVQKPTINRKYREWDVTPAMWVEALEKMASRPATLNLPLSSHGYLLDVLAGLADKTEAVAEKGAEQRIREQGSGRFNEGAEHPDEADRKANAMTLAMSSLNHEIATRKKLRMPEFTEQEKQNFIKKELEK